MSDSRGWRYSTHKAALFDKLMKDKNIRHHGKKKKVAELLKVTEDKTTQTTMHIGKLNASHVTAFAEQPGMILTSLSNSKSNRMTVEDATASCKPHSKVVSVSSRGLRSKTTEVVYSTQTSPLRNFNHQNADASSSYSRNNSPPLDCSLNFSSEENYFRSRGGSESLVSDISTKGRDYKQIEKMLHKGDVECRLSEEQPCTKEPDFPDLENLSDDLLFKNKISREEKITPKPSSSKVSRKKELIQAQTEEEAMKMDDEYVNSVRKIGRNEHNSGMIYSYVHVCVNSGLLDHAYAQIKSRKHSNTIIRNIEIYNLVIEAFAKKGEIVTVSNIMEIMDRNKVPFNCQTFALCLDCWARVPCKSELKEKRILEILKMVTRQGYRLNDIFAKTSLSSDQRENVLKQVRSVLPDFEINPSSINLNSSSPLLADLYKDSSTWKSPYTGMTSEEMDSLIDEQLALEERVICPVEAVANIENSSPNPAYDKLWDSFNERWKKNLLEVFNHNLSAMKEDSERKLHTMSIYPYLKCLPPETFVSLMEQEIKELASVSETYSASSFCQYEKLGHKVWLRYVVHVKTGDEKIRSKLKEIIKMYSQWYLDPCGPARNTRQRWQMLMEDFPCFSILNRENSFWPYIVRRDVGKFLYDIIFKSVVVPPSLGLNKESRMFPAFYLILRYVNGKLTEEIKCHPSVSKLFKKANMNTLYFSVDQLPMLCPPKPWHGWDNGGFLIFPVKCVREMSPEHRFMSNMSSVRPQQLYPIFDSLNQLQSIPWIVNEDVLDVALEVFKSGASNKLNVPSNPYVDKPLLQPIVGTEWNAREEYFRRKNLLKTINNEYGLWCEALYKFSLANHFRKRIIWSPQNLDFRGRAYPVPPHLNHLGSDLYRSLLLFARKERLGPKGLDWLKIHAINLTGTHKKKSVDERLEYANSILPKILDSTENPLAENKWWQESECPWQTLATCFEIKNALNSGSPENYKSGFPVHQDGSCNGLQHYAALGRDKFGACSVNLEPSERPQDVYSVVCNIVENARKKDAEKGVSIARDLEGYVTRKVVKRTVMTTVYGVTFFGAREQIKAELKDVESFPDDKLILASAYLAHKIFASLSEVFTSATMIQDWFLQCAKVITCNCGETVTWVTPLGLPVVQPYVKLKREGSSWIQRPIPRKQANAFAPNFIHSLDSTHMMLTSLFCEHSGVTFASIHDCFWTHPSTVDVMNVICRERFIALHSQKILNDLSEYFTKRYGNKGVPETAKVFSSLPPLGDFDLNRIIDSVYFFN